MIPAFLSQKGTIVQPKAPRHCTEPRVTFATFVEVFVATFVEACLNATKVATKIPEVTQGSWQRGLALGCIRTRLGG
jgi:hypothetical protein